MDIIDVVVVYVDGFVVFFCCFYEEKGGGGGVGVGSIYLELVVDKVFV